MADPYFTTARARWSDMDFNQHMSNSAYLDCAGQARMEFLAANGWSMAEFVRIGIGPVVLEDCLRYRKELALLAEFHISVEVAAAKPDFSRMKVRNRFSRADDGAECAVVDSVVLWFDLAARRPVVPPDALQGVWARLSRSDDFVPW